METETHPSDGKHGVVCGDLLCSLMSSTAVGSKDDDTRQKRNASHGENENLRPCLRVFSPRGHPAVVGQGSRRVEDGESSRKHGEDNERAAEVDASESKLGHTDAGLDSLCKESAS